jgi:hypothetical protein
MCERIMSGVKSDSLWGGQVEVWEVDGASVDVIVLHLAFLLFTTTLLSNSCIEQGTPSPQF